ncbi:MAG: NADH-quinone oxidoreductase subunit C [Polyangiaceae bacterium]
MSKALIDLIKKNFGAAVLETHSLYGDETVVVAASAWREVAGFLRDNPACHMDMLTDLTAVDFPEREPRFEIVAHFYSLTKGHRLRLKTRTGDEEGDDAEVDSLCEFWASANWMEREVFDMFGVIFKNHPDLRRILMYPEFEGHPLRKDYPADKIQPLMAYRDVPNIEKIAPFSVDEGMSFGRQTHARNSDDDSRVN